MAIGDWRKPREAMEQEAIAALAELSSNEDGALPLRDAAVLAIVAAHQVPELVELGAFRAGDLDEAAMNATGVVVDIAAEWDDEGEAIGEFVESLDEHDLTRLARHARIWAAAVWEQMVPLDPAEKAARLAALTRH